MIHCSVLKSMFDSRRAPKIPLQGGLHLAIVVSATLVSTPIHAQNCGDWEALSGPNGTGVIGEVFALATFDDGTGPSLYAGGEFWIAGGRPASNIAKWDGVSWSRLSIDPATSELDRRVLALTVFDDGSGAALYAGGLFFLAGGETVNGVAKWDGAAWSSLGGPMATGVDNSVAALTTFDDGSGPALFVGGYFSTAGGVTVNRIAKWDGKVWSPLAGTAGVGVNGLVSSLTVFNDGTGEALYVGGVFDRAGGQWISSIARWNGSLWSRLQGAPGGPGLIGFVQAMTSFNNGKGPVLYAGGHINHADGITVNNIARWDTSTWSDLSGPSGTGMYAPVRALTSFIGGSGPSLYAGGEFTQAGGITVNHIAKWNNSTWSPLFGPSGTGVDGAIAALTVFDDGSGPALYAGGNFITAGGVSVNRIARWRPRPPCPADLNRDCVLDLADIVAFVTAFAAQDTAADFAEPFGVLDLADVSAFVQSFQSGCQ